MWQWIWIRIIRGLWSWKNPDKPFDLKKNILYALDVCRLCLTFAENCILVEGATAITIEFAREARAVRRQSFLGFGRLCTKPEMCG